MDPVHAFSLADVLREHRRSRPGQIAHVCGDQRHTWPEVDARVNRLAQALAGEGFGAGDRILWLGQNCHRLLECLLAAAKLGGVFCPANWRQSPEELAFVIGDSAPRVVIWQQEEVGEVVRAAREASGEGALWLRHDAEGDGSYEAFLARGDDTDPETPVDADGPLLQIYTAAFSGRPGGALLSHTALLFQNLIMARIQDVGADTVFLNSGPLFHMATLMTTLATFHLGGTNVFVRRIEAEEVCRLIQDEGCTGGFLIGPSMAEIVALNRDGKYDLSSYRSFPAMPAWNEMVSRDESPWGRRPGGYGQTEVAGLLTLAALGLDAVGSHGRPTPMVQVRIVDPEGREVPVGETGEIVARGPAMMLGYHDRPDQNAARGAGGWHHTNDLGRREPDGSISFIGPKTRLIKSAAENIYPAEVEGCLKRHPAVADAAVIGVPDPKWDQSVKAIVVLAPDAEADARTLIAHCREQLASYKKPRSVEFVDALPRAGFAVDYAALDERFGGGGYPGA